MKGGAEVNYCKKDSVSLDKLKHHKGRVIRFCVPKAHKKS